MLEVEAKIALPPGEADALRATLRSLGAAAASAEEQRDTYFAHPARDFGATDEALRLRRAGDVVELTYKGPRAPGGAAKARREETVRLDGDVMPILAALGFRPVAQVGKRRESWTLGPSGVTVALDDVEGLGSFVEVEATGHDAATAGGAVEDALRRLGLAGASRIRESYLELLQRAR